MQNRRLFIYCAGGQGREALKTARAASREGSVRSGVFFVDDGFSGTAGKPAPRLPFDQRRDAS